MASLLTRVVHVDVCIVPCETVRVSFGLVCSNLNMHGFTFRGTLPFHSFLPPFSVKVKSKREEIVPLGEIIYP